jgi:hypothetical protein
MTIAEQEVRPEHLSLAVRALFHARGVPKGEWVASFSYRKLDLVSNNGQTLICLEDHISSADLNDDIENGRWMLFSSPSSVMRVIDEATYTLTGLDDGATLKFTTGCTVTLPADMESNIQVKLFQGGDDPVTVTAASGATVDCGLDGSGGDHRSTAYKGAAITVLMDENTDGESAHWWVEGVSQAL